MLVLSADARKEDSILCKELIIVKTSGVTTMCYVRRYTLIHKMKLYYNSTDNNRCFNPPSGKIFFGP
jgi:hypothetical protein